VSSETHHFNFKYLEVIMKKRLSINRSVLSNTKPTVDLQGRLDEPLLATLLRILFLAFVVTAALFCNVPQASAIHPEFPIKKPDQLSPPMIHRPIHECAQAVLVYSFVPHAKVKVYAGGNELIGEAEPDFAFAEIPLMRTLKIGEMISATQTVENMVSMPTLNPVTVSSYLPSVFNKPEVGKDIYDCGVIVPVGDLVESVRVHVMADQQKIGQAEAPGTWKAVWTRPLKEGEKVTAIQIACEEDPQRTIKSPESNPVQVKPAPRPVPAPSVGNVVIGNDKVDLYGLLVGAKVKVYDRATVVGGGAATGSANWCPIDPPISSASVITATQKLCNITSNPSSPGEITKILKAPTVVGPICDGAHHVVIRNTVINSTVFVTRNGAIVGYGGAVSGDLILATTARLNTGDIIRARQYMGTTVSPMSNQVTVQGRLEKPVIEISGDEPFFKAEPGEHQIDGAVFPRGRGMGPLIKVQTCCGEGLKVKIEGVDGHNVAEIAMTEQFPGYYTGRWDWSSTSNWAIPSGIPVGEYTTKARSGCALGTAQKRFYVIFDPNEVTASTRFIYNETGIWFGSGSRWESGKKVGYDKALIYSLHPDDNRVFSRAIQQIQGETNQFNASKKLLAYENGMFAYSLSWHGQDTIHLIEHETSAQCADDANMLTALLRSIGIPSHPVTVDAAVEYGPAGWNFDTWTEALLNGSSGKIWYALHPHQANGIGPVKRDVAGSVGGDWGVATKAYNDVAIMALENWVASEVADNNADVTFSWETMCKEPGQAFLHKASWLEHLCQNNSTGGGYWGKGHWTCSPPYRSAILIELDKDAYRVGDAIKIGVTVMNKTKRPQKGVLRVTISEDRIFSKKYPDYEHLVGRKEIVISPGQKQRLEMKFNLPLTLSSDRDYAVTAYFGDVVEKTPFRVDTSYKTRLILPKVAIVDEPFVVELLVQNATERPIEGILVNLVLPFEVRAKKETIQQRIPFLKVDDRKKLRWKLYPQAPSEVAGFQVEIQSANGGSSVIRGGLEIEGPSVSQPGSAVKLSR
jgi:hypothetical protein